MINKIKNGLLFIILIVFVYSLVLLFKNNDSSSFNKIIINVDSSFIDKTFIENFVSKEILSDSQNINYNELENKFSDLTCLLL